MPEKTRRGRKNFLGESERVTVRLDEASLARLGQWCRSLGLTRSQAVRYLLTSAPHPKARRRKGEK